MRFCEQCGKTLKVRQYSGKRHKAKFCSQVCRNRHRADEWHEKQGKPIERDETLISCDCCGRQFMSVKSNQKYCSPQCKYLYSRNLKRARRGKPMDMHPIIELRIAAMRDSWTPEQRIEKRTLNSPPLGTLE